MTPSTLADLSLEFVKAYRAAQELPDLARKLAASAALASAADLEALDSVLKVLNVPAETIPEAGKEFENRLRSQADRQAHEVFKVGVHASQAAAVLAAKKTPTPGHVQVADFGPGVKVLEVIGAPPGRGLVAYGPLDRLAADHPLKKRLSPADCPTAGGVPVVYLGKPAQGIDGAFRSAPEYPLAVAVSWTQEAARRQKEEAERERMERERIDREARERYRKVPTLEEVAAQVERLLAGMDELRNAGIKVSDDHRREVARLSAQVHQLSASRREAEQLTAEAGGKKIGGPA